MFELPLLSIPTSCLVSLTHVPLFSLDLDQLLRCLGGSNKSGRDSVSLQ